MSNPATPSKQQIYLITGPRFVGPNYFNKHYAPLIDDALCENPLCRFVLGDAPGVDRLAQQYLASSDVSADRVTVHVLRGKTPHLERPGWGVVATALDWTERDADMARIATDTIAVLPQYGGGTSGAVFTVLLARLGLSSGGYLDGSAVDAHDVLRQHAEPYDEPVAKFMALLYEHLYAPAGERDVAACQAALAALLAK